MPAASRQVREELRTFFDQYTARFNEALEGSPDLDGIAAQYAATFMAAGPQGVAAGQNDGGFLDVLRQGFEQYRRIGTKRMTVRAVEVTAIDGQHALARIAYRASYIRPADGEPIEVDFEVTYLLQHQERWRIFAFIAGDEEALYREYGLMPSDTPPADRPAETL